MKSVPAWLSYSVIRLLLFAVPLVILLVTGVGPIVATIIAAIIGLCLSYIFLRTPRARMADTVYRARHEPSTPAPSDADVEDAAIDETTPATPLSEGEGGAEQQTESERREAGEFQRKHELP
ncbi:DUF4229 domain-containing protein [Cryobacterium tepidiphilum]|uniref:DUF4229 domain-containing protein n=1 Tax=Cryobacterium tepidiphilum TaxID=2486026 RepID=A0A3M8L9D5_9MICO|nr:DUF4229 domain-containing protein [Cryobacterium tepidiphilum]RNE62103.1 DUF4229 domain-containing protein [Cryobacterium tepidiphilum]